MQNLITDHLDIWTNAIKPKAAAGRGRGTGKKQELYGIKKLRELILDLAVRGLLVPQDPKDEPASVLLERIAKEKARLVKEKKIKRQKVLPEIAEEEKPFGLPEGWGWSRLRDIGHDLGQQTPENDFTYIDVGAINKELGLISEPSILSSSDAPSRARKNVKNGTVIYSTVRPYLLNIAVIENEYKPSPIASTAFAIIHPLTGVIERYIYRYLRSPIFINYVESCQTGIAYPAINDKQFFSGIIPLPPTAEQHRIVKKVDELMQLCDQLEQRSENQTEAHQTLVKTLLNTLTQAPDHAHFQAAWQRIATHFDSLFTTEQSIEQLKQSILQLAVMGKLVPQDPKDEPASELLKKIAAEKAQLLKEKKIKKQKALPEIGEEEKLFKLPTGWKWCRLQDAIDVRDGTHDSPKHVTGNNTYPLVTSKDFINGRIDFKGAKRISQFDYLEISKRSLVEVDDILFSMIGGNIGNQVMVEDNIKFTVKNVALFKYFLKTATLPIFFKIYTEELAIKLQEKASGGAQPFISLGNLRKLIFAIPPLTEQHRIVSKVDELLSLCDQLKTRLNAAQTTQIQLADALSSQSKDEKRTCMN